MSRSSQRREPPAAVAEDLHGRGQEHHPHDRHVDGDRARHAVPSSFRNTMSLGANAPNTATVIADAGRETLERVFPIHLEVVEAAFGRHIDADDAEALVGVTTRVCAAHGQPAKARTA
jgi:hypothetical protein